MKFLNKSIVAAVLGLATVTVSNAQNAIYLTGSTAARDAVFTTLTNSTTGFFDNTGTTIPTFVTFGASAPGGASYFAISNNVTVASVSTPTVIYGSWSGSEAGISDVSTGGAGYAQGGEIFLSPTVFAGVSPGNSSIISSKPTGSQTNSTLVPVDVALADNSVSYSKIPGSDGIETSVSVVVPFVFVRNKTAGIADSVNFTGITVDTFKAAIAGGAKLGLFTGNPADTKYVYIAGRDNNSGTRVNVLGETGWGITKTVKQIQLSGGNQVQFGSIYTTPQGQSSGGNLATSLADTSSSTDHIHAGTGFIAVAYLGMADDATAENLPGGSSNSNPAAIRLTYNGVAYSNAAVENGQYSIWGNEYIIEKASDSGTLVDTLVSDIAASLQNNTSGFEIPFSSMVVSRTGPLGVPLY